MNYTAHVGERSNRDADRTAAALTRDEAGARLPRGVRHTRPCLDRLDSIERPDVRAIRETQIGAGTALGGLVRLAVCH